MNNLLLATSNPGKIAELKALLSPIHCIEQRLLGIEDATETGLSFIENAIIKARHASQLAQKPALADDSGLVVMALQGQPGIYSARYAGEEATDQENLELLLNKMASIPPQQRQAYFYCAIAVVQHATDPTPLIAAGQLRGEISQKPMGNHGFGYDPVFYMAAYKCTMAQLSAELKNTISHRALALKQLKEQIQDLRSMVAL